MSTTPAPVPPVPPNPQKDALLHAISHTLVSQANQTLANNSAAFQSLSAQHQALLAAQQTLQSELDSLAHLSSILDSNDAALRQSIQQIDSSIASASSQRRPEIDAIIISPTIVGQQVYNAVAEEQAARDVRLALGRALDKGRIGVKEYVKEMRGVGREEFFRKAVVRKAGVGMGLEVGASGA
jgi:ESCRT-I complex subunit TSG101